MTSKQWWIIGVGVIGAYLITSKKSPLAAALKKPATATAHPTAGNVSGGVAGSGYTTRVATSGTGAGTPSQGRPVTLTGAGSTIAGVGSILSSLLGALKGKPTTAGTAPASGQKPATNSSGGAGGGNAGGGAPGRVSSSSSQGRPSSGAPWEGLQSSGSNWQDPYSGNLYDGGGNYVGNVYDFVGPTQDSDPDAFVGPTQDGDPAQFIGPVQDENGAETADPDAMGYDGGDGGVGYYQPEDPYSDPEFVGPTQEFDPSAFVGPIDESGGAEDVGDDGGGYWEDDGVG